MLNFTIIYCFILSLTVFQGFLEAEGFIFWAGGSSEINDVCFGNVFRAGIKILLIAYELTLFLKSKVSVSDESDIRIKPRAVSFMGLGVDVDQVLKSQKDPQTNTMWRHHKLKALHWNMLFCFGFNISCLRATKFIINIGFLPCNVSNITQKLFPLLIIILKTGFLCPCPTLAAGVKQDGRAATNN